MCDRFHLTEVAAAGANGFDADTAAGFGANDGAACRHAGASTAGRGASCSPQQHEPYKGPVVELRVSPCATSNSESPIAIDIGIAGTVPASRVGRLVRVDHRELG